MENMSRKTKEAIQLGLEMLRILKVGQRTPAETAISLASAFAHAAAEVTNRYGKKRAMEFMRVYRGAFFAILRDSRGGLIVPFDAMPGPSPGVSEIFGG